jgi:hypothetical protein
MEQDAHGTTLFNMPAVQAMLTSSPRSESQQTGTTTAAACDSSTTQQQQQQQQQQGGGGEEVAGTGGVVVYTTRNMGRQGATLLAQLVAQLDCAAA